MILQKAPETGAFLLLWEYVNFSAAIDKCTAVAL